MLFEDVPLLTLALLALAMAATELWRIAADDEALLVCRTDDSLLAAIAAQEEKRAEQAPASATGGWRSATAWPAPSLGT
jgi:hypothetical protein